MAQTFRTGDHVQWNYSGDKVTGKITKVHTSDTGFKGQMHRCSKDDPQYEIESDNNGSTAMHKGSALGKAD